MTIRDRRHHQKAADPVVFEGGPDSRAAPCTLQPREDAAMTRFTDDLAERIEGLKADGLFKAERVIETPQGGVVADAGGETINLCANNYLGLSDHPALVAKGREALDRWGYGMSSVRFICGTQAPHKALERRLADWLG